MKNTACPKTRVTKSTMNLVPRKHNMMPNKMKKIPIELWTTFMKPIGRLVGQAYPDL